MLNLTKTFRSFVADKSGAVTVDWVALTAAVVIIGIGIVYTVFGSGSDGVSGLVTNLTSEMSTAANNLSGAVGALPTAGNGGGS